MKNKELPVVGITIGDYNGIGPEVVLKAFSDNRLFDQCIAVVYASPKIIHHYKHLLQLDKLQHQVLKSKDPKLLSNKALNIVNCLDDEFEIHPGEDLHDGVTFEMFLERVKNHSRANMLYDPSHYVLQHLDYLDHIDIYHDRIKMFHVKDAELNPTGRQGVYGGYQSWVNRAGRFRSPGDGQVDFGGIFSKLTQYGFDGWAVVEWECCLKHPEDGAREGAAFVDAHIIRVTERAFDDFADSGVDTQSLHRMLGI